MPEHQNLDDPDAGKGAVEGDRDQPTNTSMSGQNPHRVRTRMVKDNDSDFPEPGGSPEHSGENVEPQNTRKVAGDNREGTPVEGADIKGRSPEREIVNQDPGERQKENQNTSKDDPLAA